MAMVRSNNKARRRGGAWRAVIFAGIAVLCAWKPAYADRAGMIALDLNYPGFGLRYFVENQTAIEARGQFLDGDKLGGARVYRYFTNEYQKPRGLDLFMGLEADYVSFKGSSSSGKGAAGEFFLGGEYFFSRSFSLQLDGGPAYMSITDSGTSLGVSRFDVVVNFGINLYFWLGPSDADSFSPSTSETPRNKRNPDEVTP
jgi:hypothetical protein